MSYPQPNPDKYALGGYKFFRLNTKLISDGDIYESAQGAQGFAVGPDSDISKVNIAYFDEQVSGYMNQVAITPDRPFPGEILARNDAKYAPSSRPGRTLIWPDELYNSSYIPTGIWEQPDARVDFEVPVLDVVQYFSPQGLSMSPLRNDKTYRYPFIPVPGVGGLWAVIIPYYGRRFASISLTNVSGGNDINVAVGGLIYRPGTGPSGAGFHALAGGSLTVATGTTDVAVIKASVDGMYDALQILVSGQGLDPTDNNTLRVVVSDREP